MEIDNKFVSIVVIGNFNPAILDAKFLKDVCMIPIGDVKKESVTPVQSRVDCENISFVANLDLFKIVHNDIVNFAKSKIPSYLDMYLNKLQHTPINACGINFNIDISETNRKKIEEHFVNDRSSLLGIVKAKSVIIGNMTAYDNKGGSEVIQYSIGYEIEEQTVLNRIMIEKKNELIFNMNYNYEIRNLRQNRERIKMLTEKYEERFEEYQIFVKKVLS
ncbi:MAG: hypothetical protein ABH836_04665 [Candidatus Omnitrophota bacterium]